MKNTIVLMLLATFAGCASVRQPKFKVDTRDEMHHEISVAIPIGTPVDVAKQTMETAGFKCEFITSGSFSEDTGIIGDTREHPAIVNTNYLFCNRSESASLLTAHMWCVAIATDENNTVSDVLVRHYMEGM